MCAGTWQTILQDAQKKDHCIVCDLFSVPDDLTVKT